jgi:8-oxo-dGTP pyrophosphatase MutT (NUDIX family)
MVSCRDILGEVHLVEETSLIERQAVYGIIRNERGVLLVRDRSSGNRWDLPGGGVDASETPLQALRREIKEETGLEVINQPTKVCELLEFFFDIDSKCAWRSERLFYFLSCAGKLASNGNADDILAARYVPKPFNTVEITTSTRAILKAFL